MKNNITELVFILDRSGSMAGLVSDTIGGFNSMIERQKKEQGEVYVTTVLFDTRFDRIHDRKKLAEVPVLTEKDYVPGGCTALLDAIGSTVRHIAHIHRYARPEDVPEKTVVVITTDGLENASREYSYEQVKQLISQKEKDGWNFLFLGANIDAASEAERIGIASDNAATYVADEEGTRVMYKAQCDATVAMRSGSFASGGSWKRAIEKDAARRGFSGKR